MVHFGRKYWWNVIISSFQVEFGQTKSMKRCHFIVLWSDSVEYVKDTMGFHRFITKFGRKYERISKFVVSLSDSIANINEIVGSWFTSNNDVVSVFMVETDQSDWGNDVLSFPGRIRSTCQSNIFSVSNSVGNIIETTEYRFMVEFGRKYQWYRFMVEGRNRNKNKIKTIEFSCFMVHFGRIQTFQWNNEVSTFHLLGR